ncbi:acyl-CoA dehydrogenase family protein [Amycolatopsis taiwanensis]|uniref:Acyl-CoA dehydrogenase n=1 Tax=Amycolatopsis taiwanensis TaxID=342230 RepID=A0A9W6QXD8_9PSEU|nr:acyl-CoA dehydrogenase family protein [Amycolatopsis taiwanensis]GLY64228.1 acyl-CoA dehydrogenase [Amycolatopsis taiwanensis]
MTSTGQLAPGTADVVARAASVAEVLAAQANEVDAQRRLTGQAIRALTEAGMFRLMTPVEFGGYGVDVSTLSEVAKVLARSCASSAWITVIYNGTKMLAAHFSEEARQEVFATDPDAGMASIFAPSGVARQVAGGYRVSGRWPWASGILHARWGIGMAPIVDDGGTPVGAGFALMPTEDLSIEDTWYTVGMRGTGSNTMVAEDVFVPHHRMLAPQNILASPKQTDPSAPQMLRTSPVAGLVSSLAAPMVGVAQVALAFVTAKAPKRAISYTSYPAQIESQVFVKGIGEAAMQIDSAELHLARTTRMIDAAAAEARELTLDERRKVRGDVGHAMNEVCLAFNQLMNLHGSSAFAEVNPLQRMWRDANTGSRHATFATNVNYEVHGGALVGLPPITDLL